MAAYQHHLWWSLCRSLKCPMHTQGYSGLNIIFQGCLPLWQSMMKNDRPSHLLASRSNPTLYILGARYYASPAILYCVMFAGLNIISHVYLALSDQNVRGQGCLASIKAFEQSFCLFSNYLHWVVESLLWRNSKVVEDIACSWTCKPLWQLLHVANVSRLSPATAAKADCCYVNC